MNYNDLPTWAKNLYTQTVARAKKRGDDFEFERSDYAEIFSDRCSLTNIPFEFDKGEWHEKRPFAASIDRIDSKKGYVKGNCRLVCVAVNLAMNTWGEAVLYRIAAGLTHDKLAWDQGIVRHAGKLPRGVQMHFVSKDGPRYRGSKYVNDVRMYTRSYRTPKEALDALIRNDFKKREYKYSPRPTPNAPAQQDCASKTINNQELTNVELVGAIGLEPI